MHNNKEIKLGAILSYLIIFANMIIGVLYTPILTSKLGQSEYGLYSLVTSIISYLTILDFGFGNAIIIYTARYRKKNEKEKEQELEYENNNKQEQVKEITLAIARARYYEPNIK